MDTYNNTMTAFNDLSLKMTILSCKMPFHITVMFHCTSENNIYSKMFYLISSRRDKKKSPRTFSLLLANIWWFIVGWSHYIAGSGNNCCLAISDPIGWLRWYWPRIAQVKEQATFKPVPFHTSNSDNYFRWCLMFSFSVLRWQWRMSRM